jgi:hypothetical protein
MRRLVERLSGFLTLDSQDADAQAGLRRLGAR